MKDNVVRFTSSDQPNMNVYQLDKPSDKDFVSGKPVTCRVTLKEGEEDVLKEGSTLVIMLSNGAKYKGVIVKKELAPLGTYYIGEITVERLRT
jgi:hypothetical protein